MIQLGIFMKKIQLKIWDTFHIVHKSQIFTFSSHLSIVLKRNMKIKYCSVSLGRQENVGSWGVCDE